MKNHIEKLAQLAAQSANSAGRGLSNVQHMAQDLAQAASQIVNKDTFSTDAFTKEALSKKAFNTANAATASAYAAGKSLQQSLTHVVEHETTQALIEQVKDTSQQIVDSAAHGAKFVGNQVIDGVKKIDGKLEENHLDIKEKTETVSMGLGIAAGVAAGAAIIGPPIVVAAAPVIGAAATVTGAVAGTAYFYSKWKTNKTKTDGSHDSEKEHSPIIESPPKD